MLGFAASLVSALLLVACEEEPEGPAVDNTPIVGLYEMPISRNNQGSEPQNALRLDISQTLMRLNGTKVLDLEGGEPADGQISDEHIVTRLREQIQAGTARERTALTVGAMLPYSTLVAVLNTLQSTNQHEVILAVRTVGNSPQAAWMPLTNWRVTPVEGEAEFEGRPPPWSAFTEHWREVYTACRAGESAGGRSSYVNCDGPHATSAEGGDLAVELWTRGQAMKVSFSQHLSEEATAEAEAEAAAEEAGPELIEGVQAAPPRPGEEIPPPPATAGVFTVRHQESVEDESSLSALVAPVCADVSCFATVVTDAGTHSMRVVSMIGAVFPNGTTAPQLRFQIPTR